MGKGSQRRPEDKGKIDANWDKIFTAKNQGPAMDGNPQTPAGQPASVPDVQQQKYNQAGNRG